MLYYALALASYLDGDKTAARKHLADLQSHEHEYLMYEGREKALQALLDADESLLHTGIEMMLRAHQDEYRSNPDTAVAFLSIDAMVYLQLAHDDGLSIDRKQFPAELQESLPEKFPIRD